MLLPGCGPVPLTGISYLFSCDDTALPCWFFALLWLLKVCCCVRAATALCATEGYQACAYWWSATCLDASMLMLRFCFLYCCTISLERATPLCASE